MFRNKETNNLLLEFKKESKMSIHSFFVSFPFLVIWLDKKNNVLGFKFVKPFRFKITSRKPFYKLVEVPLNNRNKKIINYFVGKKEKFKNNLNL